MASIIDSLIVTLGLDASQFTSGQKAVATGIDQMRDKTKQAAKDDSDRQKQQREDLKRTKDEAQQRAKEIEAAGKRAADFFTRLRTEALLLFAAFAGTSGLKQFVENITTSDAATSKLAHNLGMSTELLSEWETAAARTGGSAEATGQSFEGLTQQLVELSTFHTSGAWASRSRTPPVKPAR